ncbi:MAG: YobA family protein [Gemmatimonadota bacterium]|nr:YobA family protein [Gemmatimonadota bacterium]
MFSRVPLLILGVASLWLTACSTVLEPSTVESASTRGTITEVPTRLRAAAFLIEEKVTGIPAEPRTAGDKYYVFVTERTTIERRTSAGTVRSASLAEITAGMQAEVWFVGPIRESYPAQANAGRILILDPAR